MVKPKLYIPDYSSYGLPFLRTFDITSSLDYADVVMFTGGADIDPAFYQEKRGAFTNHPSNRDIREKRLFDYSLSKGKKFLGICRGAQLLCAMAGGKLVQHIEHHELGYNEFHRLTTNSGAEIFVNSLHHQMMHPKDTKHELIAWTERLSRVYWNGDNKQVQGIEVEPEICYFPDVRGLGIQCHPESGFPEKHPALSYFNQLVRTRLLGESS